MTDVKRSVYLERTALKLKAMFLGNGHGFKKKVIIATGYDPVLTYYVCYINIPNSKEFFMKDIND